MACGFPKQIGRAGTAGKTPTRPDENQARRTFIELAGFGADAEKGQNRAIDPCTTNPKA